MRGDILVLKIGIELQHERFTFKQENTWNFIWSFKAYKFHSILCIFGQLFLFSFLFIPFLFINVRFSVYSFARIRLTAIQFGRLFYDDHH